MNKVEGNPELENLTPETLERVKAYLESQNTKASAPSTTQNVVAKTEDGVVSVEEFFNKYEDTSQDVGNIDMKDCPVKRVKIIQPGTEAGADKSLLQKIYITDLDWFLDSIKVYFHKSNSAYYVWSKQKKLLLYIPGNNEEEARKAGIIYEDGGLKYKSDPNATVTFQYDFQAFLLDNDSEKPIPVLLPMKGLSLGTAKFINSKLLSQQRKRLFTLTTVPQVSKDGKVYYAYNAVELTELSKFEVEKCEMIMNIVKTNKISEEHFIETSQDEEVVPAF